ncbi:MAG: transcription elongation factor GreB [Deltaproteobacteria bacterium]|nr:transcription elongation factor GreB [Deltaproteobacteria bacterium]
MVKTRGQARSSQPRAAEYITAEGYRRLEEEADYLWTVKRPQVVAALADAAAEGDRSENAEYLYRKRQVAEIDRRLRFLSTRMDAVTMVTEKPRADGRVYFGCYVTVEDEEGHTKRYRIVGADEWDSKRSEISMDSPMGKALLGKRLDDEVMVRRPIGDIYLTIVAVSVDP